MKIDFLTLAVAACGRTDRRLANKRHRSSLAARSRRLRVMVYSTASLRRTTCHTRCRSFKSRQQRRGERSRRAFPFRWHAERGRCWQCWRGCGSRRACQSGRASSTGDAPTPAPPPQIIINVTAPAPAAPIAAPAGGTRRPPRTASAVLAPVAVPAPGPAPTTSDCQRADRGRGAGRG